MRNEIRTVLALALGLAAVPATAAWADSAATNAAAAEATTAVLPRVGAALHDLRAGEVRKLQTALQQAGHYEGALDGVAGPATQAALAAFQRAQLQDGTVLDPTTQRALGLQIASAEPVAAKAEPIAAKAEPITAKADGVKPALAKGAAVEAHGAKTPVAASAVPAPPSSGTPGHIADSAQQTLLGAPAQGTAKPTAGTEFALAELSHGQLEQLQSRLRELGHYSGPLDGLDGPRTRQAFRDFFNHQLGLMTNQVRITREGALALGMDLAAMKVQGAGKQVTVTAADAEGTSVVANRAVPAPHAPAAE